MDDRVDVTKRKPRRLRGTPALSFIHRASLIVLGVGVAIGLATTLSLSLVEKLREKYNFDVVNVSEREQDRRLQFRTNFAKARTGEEVLEILKQQEESQSNTP